jgi:AAA15 family ATPase/GTPase
MIKDKVENYKNIKFNLLRHKNRLSLLMLAKKYEIWQTDICMASIKQKPILVPRAIFTRSLVEDRSLKMKQIYIGTRNGELINLQA